MRICVENISASTTKTMLRDAFSVFGTVDKCSIPMDRSTGLLKGFGIVEMRRETEGEVTISRLNNSTLNGNLIVVSEVEPKLKARKRAVAKG